MAEVELGLSEHGRGDAIGRKLRHLHLAHVGGDFVGISLRRRRTRRLAARELHKLADHVELAVARLDDGAHVRLAIDAEVRRDRDAVTADAHVKHGDNRRRVFIDQECNGFYGAAVVEGGADADRHLAHVVGPVRRGQLDDAATVGDGLGAIDAAADFVPGARVGRRG